MFKLTVIFHALSKVTAIHRLKMNLFWKQIRKNSVIRGDDEVWSIITNVSKEHESVSYNLNKETGI